MAQLDAELIQVIKKSIQEVITDQQDEFYVPRKDHFLDHEFISEVRTGIKTGRRATWWIAAVSAISFMAGAIWLAIKTALRGG